ncbi:MAG: tetratricopeptide repeat protein [Hydrogenovibrio sp.]|uniref:tetratricopeptide repeat protein n=1 Tax=Hydrogenovibrio sp. TaxID=2065821 RepID=UPI002870565D|nr:tetratricopeptide repeat protein [Hydrogenovibrio sp.]MDR9499918.1 tetratricopeptide repeat protein [Hydrogenovibrio sp.]
MYINLKTDFDSLTRHLSDAFNAIPSKASPVRLKILIGWCVLLLALPFQASASSLKAGVDAFANKNYAKAFEIFKDRSLQGDPIAQFGLAKMYRKGLGRPVHYQNALKWYHKASQQNYAVAMAHIGEMYEQGLGVQVNLDTAKNWYRMACSNRCSDGCRHLKRLDEKNGY